MDFIGRVACGSFVVSAFTGDYDADKLEGSRVVRFFDFIFNSIPKPFGKPFAWPERAARFLNGSGFVRLLTNALDTPVNPASSTDKPSVLTVLGWFFNAIPVWGMLAVVAAAPILGNSMPLAMALAAVFLLTWLSRRVPLDLTALFVLLFIVVQIFFGITSFHFASSIQIAMLTAVLMLSFFIVNACVVNRRQLDMFFFVFIAAAMVTGFIGIYQLVMKIVDMTWVDVDLFGAIQLRTFASFANPNVFGTYLLLTVPLSAVMIIYAKNVLLKLAALGVTGLLLYNLVMTYSRGCYLALAVAALFFILLIGKRIMVFVMAGLLTLPVTLPLMIPFIPQNVLNRILSITNLSDSSTSYRLSIWQATLRILQDFWAVGLGQGIEAYTKVYPYYGFNAVVAPHSHNLFLQIFVETGILGLLVFLGLLAAFFRTMASYLRKERDWRRKAVAMAMMSGVVGFLFQGIFDYVFYNNRVLLIFYIYLALGTVFARIGSKEAEIAAKKEGERFVSGYES
jgi:putative inorganic carbon (HCO3(-)) transporter